MILALEWASYLGVLVATWLYGYSGLRGPLAGMIAASLFIIYGFAAEIPAAWVTNGAFFLVHARNAWKAAHNPFNKDL